MSEADEAEPVMIGGVWYWSDDESEPIGPAELHEMELCNSSECDWCGEDEEGDDGGD